MIRVTIDGAEIVRKANVTLPALTSGLYTAKFELTLNDAGYWDLYRRLFSYELPEAKLWRRVFYWGRKGRSAWRRLHR